MTFHFNSRIGLGTWQMGEHSTSEHHEIQAIASAIEMGYPLIDTAEMYASGQVETLIGKALKTVGASRRESLQIVSKVLPSNASTKGTIAACEASIKRIGCKYIDCYLLHWQGPHSYEATLEGMIALQERGLIRSYGISNFDAPDVLAWLVAQTNVGGPYQTVCNQVYYALNARGIEYDLIPVLQEHDITLMAYSPLGAGALMTNAKLLAIANPLGISPAQLALAWILRLPHTVAIPKTVNPQRLEENWMAREIQLDQETLAQLDQVFPPPTRKHPLMVI